MEAVCYVQVGGFTYALSGLSLDDLNWPCCSTLTGFILMETDGCAPNEYARNGRPPRTRAVYPGGARDFALEARVSVEKAPTGLARASSWSQ